LVIREICEDLWKSLTRYIDGKSGKGSGRRQKSGAEFAEEFLWANDFHTFASASREVSLIAGNQKLRPAADSGFEKGLVVGVRQAKRRRDGGGDGPNRAQVVEHLSYLSLVQPEARSGEHLNILREDVIVEDDLEIALKH
jgi:hypothetical protein